MRDDFIAPAAAIAAALIQRIPASEPNNGVKTEEIKSAFIQAMAALEMAEEEMFKGDGTAKSFWEASGS